MTNRNPSPSMPVCASYYHDNALSRTRITYRDEYIHASLRYLHMYSVQPFGTDPGACAACTVPTVQSVPALPVPRSSSRHGIGHRMRLLCCMYAKGSDATIHRPHLTLQRDETESS